MKPKTFTVGWKNYLAAQYLTKYKARVCKFITTKLKTIIIQYEFLNAVFKVFGERDGDSRLLLDLDLAAAEDLLCNLIYLYYSDISEKYGELYEPPLSE